MYVKEQIHSKEIGIGKNCCLLNVTEDCPNTDTQRTPIPSPVSSVAYPMGIEMIVADTLPRTHAHTPAIKRKHFGSSQFQRTSYKSGNTIKDHVPCTLQAVGCNWQFPTSRVTSA